jgi:nucleoside-diphosphate-sugar epimerase
MRVAVTGGTGFIGRRLIARLRAEGHEVRVLSRRGAANAGLGQGVDVIEGDLECDTTDLRQFVGGVDVLYHCAGELRNVERMHAVHVTGTARLLAAVGGKVGRWIQLSSVGAYGPQRSGIVVEDTPLSPRGEYEITKTEADRLVRDAAAQGLPSVIVRPSNVFGPGMPNRSLYQMMGMIQRGLFFFIGRSGASANYVHVDNVVDALLLCGLHPSAVGRTYIVSDFVELEHFVAMLAKSLGRPTPKLRVPESVARLVARLGNMIPKFPLTPSRVDALVVRSRYSIERIRRELGFELRVTMEEGLRELARDWIARTGNRHGA